MSAIGGLLGLNGGFQGTGASLTNGTDPGQLAASQAGVQGTLGSQQQLLQALQAQNGIGNQSQVYNQLQGVANGTGPNPAQAQLAQATGQNVQNQAALMAGQRGAGANVGLMARQAAQQGANTQQQAAGQAATLQANQSLNALGQAGNLANTQVGQQMGQAQAIQQGQLQNQQTLQGANNAMNTAQAGLASTGMQGQASLAGGVLQGLGGAAAMLADGGTVGGPQSGLGKFLSGMGSSMSAGSKNSDPLRSGAAAFGQGIGQMLMKPATPQTDANFKMPEFGSQFAGQAPSLGMTYSKGGNVGSKLKGGGNVPGQAQVKGNSYANDKVKALLSPGEGVIDRETMGDKGPVGDAARFVMAYVNKKKAGK